MTLFDGRGYYEQQFGDRVRGIRKGGPPGGRLSGPARVGAVILVIVLVKALTLGFGSGSHRSTTLPLPPTIPQIEVPQIERLPIDPPPHPEGLRGLEEVNKLLPQLEEEERLRQLQPQRLPEVEDGPGPLVIPPLRPDDRPEPEREP